MRAVIAWLRAPGRLAALAVLAAAIALYTADPFLIREARLRGFDAMQRLWPRPPTAEPVIIVDVDEDAIRQQGQWPWPRTLVARLIDRIAAGKPKVLGIDIFFAEPDRLSPNQLPKFLPDLPAPVSAALAELPPSDAALARAIAATPTVLAVAPTNDAPLPQRGPHKTVPVMQKGEPAAPFALTFRSVIRSLPEIVGAARSEASIGAEPDQDGVVRSIPLVVAVGDDLIPAFALEILRIGTRPSPIVVSAGERGIASVGFGPLAIPTDARGRTYVHFGLPAERYISAQDVLADGFDPARLKDRFVLLGVSALGTVDQKNTPLGVIFGTEIHAQLIESVLSGALLLRPPQAFAVELGLILGGGLLVIALLPYQRPVWAGVGLLGVLVVLVGAEAGLFRFSGWLIDGVFAGAASLAAFGAMLGGNFRAVQRERQLLEAELQREREVKARLEGELTAARAIQMGLLPHHFPAFPERPEIDLYARIEPARDVGGDLFDFFLLDRNRLFFMIGDVSGKGIPAALFMAMSKEVVRDAAAQHGAALDALLATANRKIGAASDNLAEDGADLMFVTAFAGCLDLASGDLVFASAGHDSPLVIMEGERLRELSTEGGPPLGMVEDFAYPTSHDRLEAGAILLLYTDGVTEAQNAGGTLYGGERLSQCLAQIPAHSAREAIDLVFDDVGRFVGAAEQFDDITLLALRRAPP